MKVVILAGGLPSTVSEEDGSIPKPMAEIGGRPILWHIMKQYSHYGFRDFIICTGYRGEMVKQYFMDYYIYQSDITVDLQRNEVMVHRKKTEDWNVSVVDTGRDSSVVQRIQLAQEQIGRGSFLVTYGDYVSDIDIGKMVQFHKEHGRYATVAVAHPTGRSKMLPVGSNSELCLDGQTGEDAWVNACSMVFEPEVFRFINEGQLPSEQGLLELLSEAGEAMAYRHGGFWLPMETRRDRAQLELLWKEGRAPWKVWDKN